MSVFRLINTQNGVEIGQTERPLYIKKSAAGVYIESKMEEAEGIAYKGNAYNLYGRNGVGADETAMLVEFDAGDIGVEAQSGAGTAAIAFVVLAESGSIDDVTAGEHVDLFSPWVSGVAYAVGNLRQYEGSLYRCIQAHTAQSDWTPDVAVSLWVKTSDPAEEWPPWSRPLGAHDAYDLGAKVTHNGKHWLNTFPANSYEPGVHGWQEVA